MILFMLFEGIKTLFPLWQFLYRNIPYIKSNNIPYSREQKHVLISDTPMLLIEINSISNMGCQKWKLSEWAEIKIL